MNRRDFSKLVGLGGPLVLGAGTGLAGAQGGSPGAKPTPARASATGRVARAERTDWAKEHFKGFENIVMPSFTPDLKGLDEAGIRLDIRKSIEHGFFSALLPGIGLTPQEWRRFIEIGVDEAKGRISIAIAGEGGESGPAKRQMLQDAEAIGATHAILSLPPQGSAEDLVRYGTEISASTNLGIYLWQAQIHNFRRFHANGIPYEVYDALAKLPNIIALKVGDPNPAVIFELFERYNEHMLIGALMLNIMPMAIKAYGQQWSGAFTIEALQTPQHPYATQFFELMRAGDYDAGMKLYWRYLEPAFNAMMRVMGPLMPSGGHPWEHMKIYQFLGGGNGGRMRPDPHQPNLPALKPEDVETVRELFQSLGLEPVDLPFEAMLVGRINYEKGVRAEDLV